MPGPEAAVHSELLPYMEPELAPSPGDHEESLDDHGVPTSDPYGDSHPELRANLRWTPLPDLTVKPTGRFLLTRLLGRMR